MTQTNLAFSAVLIAMLGNPALATVRPFNSGCYEFSGTLPTMSIQSGKSIIAAMPTMVAPIEVTDAMVIRELERYGAMLATNSKVMDPDIAELFDSAFWDDAE